jgi:hypothetical protein
MPRVGFEPTIPAFERAMTLCLRWRGHCDRRAQKNTHELVAVSLVLYRTEYYKSFPSLVNIDDLIYRSQWFGKYKKKPVFY